MPCVRLSDSFNSIHLHICIIAVLIYELIMIFTIFLLQCTEWTFLDMNHDLAKLIITSSVSLLICCGNQKVCLFVNSL